MHERLRCVARFLPLLVLPWASAGAGAEPERPIPHVGDAEKVQVNLVLIDVVVRDRKDRPISGLTRDDFELLVDRLPVPSSDIETFEEICAPAEAARLTPPPGTPPPGTPTQAQEPVAVPQLRHFVVYLDFSQMSPSGANQALKAAREHFLNRIGDSDRVMILAHKKGLRLVQDFTSDRALLASRIDELMADSTTIDTDVLEEGRNLADMASKACDPKYGRCSRRADAAMSFSAQEELRARRSLKALEGLMPALAGLKGRKALVLFTDALREEPGVQYAQLARTTPQALGVSISSDVLRLTREANAAGVSIYTVHASGLDDHTVEQFRDARTIEENPKLTNSGDQPPIEMDSFPAAQAGLDSALAMQTTLAAETGGRSLKRTNDLAGILETARTDLSCYYLLGYRTQSRANDERHSLIV
ncbi:MAG TPA: VWA domain-containing protein, partial [Candidatus Polarisedimenticolia bacterium]|nr:VWA domain-containing protein [Candidatus Polarisedimenticolia bacterium]